MKERPILMTGESVRGILEGQKTMTRRPLKPQPPPHLANRSFRPITDNLWGALAVSGNAGVCRCEDTIRCPYGVPGDRLWVRETWKPTRNTCFSNKSYIRYRADDSRVEIAHKMNCGGQDTEPWHPSIFMPRWASRLILENVNIKVERVQDITEEDAVKEGIDTIGDPIRRFSHIWNSIYGKDAWSRNDWVWVIEFKRCAFSKTAIR